MATKSKTSAGKARPDRRYKDPKQAPPIVSEKRLTFFLPEDTFRALRKQTGYFQVANAEEMNGELPETPSALVREAIDFWLDQFRDADERVHSDDDWDARLERLRKALKSSR